MVNQPTPYADVNEVLGLLLTKVERILGNEFIGMYLYGSLSSGDFDPASSDIDFVFVTTGLLTEELVSALESMHREILASGLERAQRLEGAYVPKDLIRRHNPEGSPCPAINEGNFYIARLGSDWIIQRHVLREYGVTVKGPQPRTLIDPISPEELRQAILGILREWWFPMLDNPAWLRERGSHYHSYAVISMCRALHGLTHGCIASKPVAAHWAQAELGERWSPLIEKALLGRTVYLPDFTDEAIAFIRFTKERVETAPPGTIMSPADPT